MKVPKAFAGLKNAGIMKGFSNIVEIERRNLFIVINSYGQIEVRNRENFQVVSTISKEGYKLGWLCFSPQSNFLFVLGFLEVNKKKDPVILVYKLEGSNNLVYKSMFDDKIKPNDKETYDLLPTMSIDSYNNMLFLVYQDQGQVGVFKYSSEGKVGKVAFTALGKVTLLSSAVVADHQKKQRLFICSYDNSNKVAAIDYSDIKNLKKSEFEVIKKENGKVSKNPITTLQYIEQ